VVRFEPSVSDMTTALLTPPAPAKPRLVSRALLLRFVSIVGSSVGFYLPLSVVPLLASQSGSASSAGLATVALLVATVVCELVTPALVSRIGYRWALTLGMSLLGAPTIVLTFWDSAPAILAVSVVRGAGFAICVVAGGAVTAMLIPAERRGEGLALVGIVGGVPGLLALPAGVWVAGHWGFTPVFVVTTVVTLLALLSVPGLPGKSSAAPTCHGVLAGLRNPSLARPAAIFAASTAAVGVFITFLPLGTPTWVAAIALLSQPAAATVTRWIAGRLGDRYGTTCLLVPGLVLVGVGMACVAAIGVPAAVIFGSIVFGAGLGVLQNATLALMYARAPRGGEDAVSAIWNAAYDLGMAAGALGAGLVIAPLDYPTTFLLAAALILPALALVRRDRVSA